MKNLIKLLHYGETVKPVKGFTNYYVSNLGRVFSAKKQVQYRTLSGIEYNCIIWRELKIFYTHRYKTVTLTDKGKKRKNIYVHKLIYESFIGEYDNYYFRIVYRDKDTENCTLNNLKLEFRNKSRENILKYNKQMTILNDLIDYSGDQINYSK